MEKDVQSLLYRLNRAIMQFRGCYAEWAHRHGISYNEMLVLYAMRDVGFVTQKQICDGYLLPRQTINHVITLMRERGLLQISAEHSVGREKAFVLTQKGWQYAMPLFEAMDGVEALAVEGMGKERIGEIIKLLTQYNRLLEKALPFTAGEEWQVEDKRLQEDFSARQAPGKCLGGTRA